MVLLHGLGVDRRMWALQVPALQELGHVWAPDLPGFGAEAPLPGDRRTPEAYVEWVVGGLEERGWDRVAVAGYSMGGTLALLLTLRYPHRVERLALCCTSACWGRGLRGWVAQVFSGLGRQHAMEVFERSVLWGFSRHSRDVVLRAEVLDMVRRAHRPTMLQLYRRLARVDLRGELARVEVPTLVVGGTRDWLAPPSHQRVLASGVPDARLRLLPGADHILCLGRADDLTAALAGFLGNREQVSEEPSTCA
jgi:pimeloyl-ACP methyl ester carboxylesterase